MQGAGIGGTVEGGTVEGGAVVDGTVERGTVVGGTFGNGTVVGGSVEGVGVGAMMVMMIGGGDGTPCIWTGEKEERGVVGERTGEEGGKRRSVRITGRRAVMLSHMPVLITSVSGAI